MSELRFKLVDWSAWAPGLDSPQQWRAWAPAPSLPCGDDTPALAQVPAMQRRRLSRLGRAVAAVTMAAQGDGTCPMVFASRYGELERALGAIDSLVAGEAVSPAVFAASVHNGIAAQLAIIGGQRQNMVTLAAGRASAAAGLVEAAGLLADGAAEALLVCYDEPLPPSYEVFADEPQTIYAWAWRLAAADATGQAPTLRLACRAADDDTVGHDATLPAGLQPMHWLLGGAPQLRQRSDGSVWTWSRDD